VQKVNRVSIENLRIENQHELEQMIPNELNRIEEGLTVICTNIPVNDKTTLDILCHDNNGQLVIVQLSIDEDDFILFHGIQGLDYVDKFKAFLKATYNKHTIDEKTKPRLVLIAPSFSDVLLHAVESMKGMPIDLYEWEYLKFGDHKGFRLRPVFTWKPSEKPKEEKPDEKKHELKPSKKKEQEPTLQPESKDQPKPETTPEPERPKQEGPSSQGEMSKEEPSKKKTRLF
jgi:hypothetical protein